MGKSGGILGAVLGVAVTLLVLFKAVPVIWPLVTSASTNVTSMNGTDAGTTTMVAFVPVILIMVGIGIAIALVMYAVNKFRLSAGV